MSTEEEVSILIVDDQPSQRLAIETTLADLGHNLVKATSGKDALRCLLKQDFALILLDVHMPGLDGFETAALIRERPRSRHTPIMFLTATDTFAQLQFQGYSIGAVDYIPMPAPPEILRAKVKVFVDLFKRTENIKQQAQQLDKLNQELHLRSEEREQLNVMLQAVNKDLESFCYSVSHDLRAPLRAIDGFSCLLLERYASALDAQGQHYLQRVREGTVHMGQLIEDMLSLSRATLSEMHPRPVDLSAMAHNVIDPLQATTPDRQVEFVIAPAVQAEGDANLLRLVLDNLIGNAWKFTSKAPLARIEFGQTQQNGEVVYFVRDNGAGFDMAYVHKLFGAFQRLHAGAEFEGTGIGLATVRRIVSRHGGRVWAEGAVGKGATFFFTLSSQPLNKTAAPAIAAPVSSGML